MNIIIVDDEKRQRIGIQNTVQAIRPKDQVISLASGAEVLRYLTESQVDMIISDINMPDLDGLQMLEAIRARGLKIPVIFLSGYALFAYAQRAIKMGAFGYLLKPIDPDEVREVIEQAVLLLNQSEIQTSLEVEQETGSRHAMAKRIEQYLSEHYMQDLSLEEVAEAFGLNPNYFSGLVKSLTGETFSKTLANVRIERAKVLLRDVDLNVYDVAEMVGYKTPSYFTQVFKAQVGVGPEQYRRTTRRPT